MLRRASLRLAYLLAVALFFEGAARVALRSDRFFERVAGNDEASWRLRWIERHEKLGRIYFEFDVWSPTRGWAVKPGLRDLPVFGGERLSSNSRGLRGRREYSYDKPPGLQRIVVLGDSFTFGEEVSDDETYSHALEEMLPGVEVLNLGVHGYGHDQMLVYLREEGMKYRPDVVLLGFLPDDMERNVLAFRDYAKPRFELNDGRLEVRGTPVPSPEELVAREPYRSRFRDLLTMLLARWRWRSGRTPDEMRRVTQAILDEIAATARGAGAQPAFAYLPVYGEIDKADMTMTARERLFFSYCRERGIQSMYLQRFFLERRKAGVELKTYGHWGPLEHRIAAEGMKAYLLEKGLIRPPA